MYKECRPSAIVQYEHYKYYTENNKRMEDRRMEKNTS